ncbi:sugar diacid recognition domain-containing protein [Paucisalibacillus sp. EB02]|uniref:CdaR family transcriptional regulator n=1 Tax=Paucisalibacillus sp. EB02 TaxID=1347087 RepID=UPI0004B52E10|nr:sugar diacid recognition domain-containing protein [Paucisalibacillus sp. EB02]
MKDIVQFVQRIVKAVSKISPFPISISDEKGYIIGDSNPERIGTLHSPSVEVLNKNCLLSFDEETTKNMENVLPGVAIPLYFDKEIKGVLGIIGKPEEVLPYAKLIKQHVEMMWEDTIRQQISELETSLLDAFIQYILIDKGGNQEKLREYCSMLQINPYLRGYCILIDIGDAIISRIHQNYELSKTAKFKEELLGMVNSAFQKKKNDLVAFLNTEKILLIKTVPTEDQYVEQIQRFYQQSNTLLERLSSHETIRIAAGSLSYLESMHTSYREAETLLHYGKELKIQPPIFSYHQWNVLTSLLPYKLDDDLCSNVQIRMKALIEEKQFTEISKSFLHYCQNNMNITKTAEKLYIHRNTLIYRLKKIEKLTNLDLNSFEHCTLLYLTLKRYYLET